MGPPQARDRTGTPPPKQQERLRGVPLMPKERDTAASDPAYPATVGPEGGPSAAPLGDAISTVTPSSASWRARRSRPGRPCPPAFGRQSEVVPRDLPQSPGARHRPEAPPRIFRSTSDSGKPPFIGGPRPSPGVCGLPVTPAAISESREITNQRPASALGVANLPTVYSK